MSRLKNKVALVTGGNSGIGLATAAQFIKEGAKVYITGRRSEALAEAKKQLGDGVTTIQADSGKIADIERTIKAIADAGDKLDVIFYNAGIAKFVPLATLTEDHFDETLNINVKGALFTVQKSLPLLNDGASILLNGSAVIYGGMPTTSVYSLSKAAINSLAKTLSAELVGRGIRVNVVNPGPIETPIYGKTGLPQEAINEFASGVLDKVPLKRFGHVDEIAKVATFLASSDSSFLVGTAITADGGFSQI